MSQDNEDRVFGERFVAWARGESIPMDPEVARWAQAPRIAYLFAQWAGPKTLALKALEWARHAKAFAPLDPVEAGDLIASWSRTAFSDVRRLGDWAAGWPDIARACEALECALGSEGLDSEGARIKAGAAIERAIRRPSRQSIAQAWTWLAAGIDPRMADRHFEFEGGSAMSAALNKAGAWPVVGLLLEAGAEIDPKDHDQARAMIATTLCRGGGRERSRAAVAAALAARLAGSPNAYRGPGGKRLFDIAARAAVATESLDIAWALGELGVEIGPAAQRDLLVLALPRCARMTGSGAQALEFMEKFGLPLKGDGAPPAALWSLLVRDLAFSPDPAEPDRWIPRLAQWAAQGGWSPESAKLIQKLWDRLSQAGFPAMVEAAKESAELSKAVGQRPLSPKRRL